MLEYLRKHIDDLLRLSRQAKDRAVSIELREMADECRIMLSVADINDLAAELKQQNFRNGETDSSSTANFVFKPRRWG